VGDGRVQRVEGQLGAGRGAEEQRRAAPRWRAGAVGSRALIVEGSVYHGLGGSSP
jgi:hypothetical protein